MASKSKTLKLDSLYKSPTNIIKEKIKVEREFEGLIPPLNEEEYEQLEASLLKEGCRDPLIVWDRQGEYILIDGHNRYRLCNKHKISFEIQLMKFSDHSEVKNWMLSNQMARRNLSPMQMSYLRGLRYENEKLGEGRNWDKLPQLKRTSEIVADEYGVAEKTIRRDGIFAMALDKLTQGNEALRWSILSGRVQAKKSTISGLADKDDKFIEMVQARLLETESLERAIKLLLAEDGESSEEPPVSEQPADLLEVKKRLSSLVNKAMKLEKEDPKRKEVIKDLKKLFKQFVDYLDK